ncbi:MAG: glycosyltransferase family 1 protein, partial [Patescibacteria group bacterium]
VYYLMSKNPASVSEFTKQAIQDTYGRKPEDIVVTPLSYNSDLFKPTRDPKIVEKYAIKKPYILFLSSLKPSKNIERLIEAFAKLTTSRGEVGLVIAGKKAWLFDQIFAKVTQLGLTDRVIFTGFVDEADKPALMSGASAFVLPSLYEGFGIPVLEAMACGTPVVVSKIASLPEVAGSAGIYVDPLDVNSIVKGLQVAIGPTGAKYGKAGLKRVQSFSWATCAKQTLEVILSAAKNPEQ